MEQTVDGTLGSVGQGLLELLPVGAKGGPSVKVGSQGDVPGALRVRLVGGPRPGGVGELVSTFTTVTNRGGQLLLCNLSGKILDLLQITQLLQVFDTYESVDEAVAALQ